MTTELVKVAMVATTVLASVVTSVAVPVDARAAQPVPARPATQVAASAVTAGTHRSVDLGRRLPETRGYGHVHPRTIDNGGDPSGIAFALHWSHGGRVAPLVAPAGRPVIMDG